MLQIPHVMSDREWSKFSNNNPLCGEVKNLRKLLKVALSELECGTTFMTLEKQVDIFNKRVFIGENYSSAARSLLDYTGDSNKYITRFHSLLALHGESFLEMMAEVMHEHQDVRVVVDIVEEIGEMSNYDKVRKEVLTKLFYHNSVDVQIASVFALENFNDLELLLRLKSETRRCVLHDVLDLACQSLTKKATNEIL